MNETDSTTPSSPLSAASGNTPELVSRPNEMIIKTAEKVLRLRAALAQAEIEHVSNQMHMDIQTQRKLDAERVQAQDSILHAMHAEITRKISAGEDGTAETIIRLYGSEKQVNSLQSALISRSAGIEMEQGSELT